MKKQLVVFASLLLFLLSCHQTDQNKPSIGFLDLVKDETLDKARQGFYDALKEGGFDEKNINIRSEERRVGKEC